jgi:hypothetical protein
MFRGRGISAIAVVVCAAFAAPAAANSPIHIDPGSPAGKQYSIPLWVLRGEGNGQQSPEGSPAPPSFGVGIAPANALGRNGAGSTGAGRSSGAGAGGAGGHRSGPTGAAGHSGSGPSGGAGGNGANGSLSPAAIRQLIRQQTSTPETTLIAVAVLVAGLLLGAALLLARRRRGEGA